MKNVLAMSTVAIMLLAGCSSKEPAIDATAESGAAQEKPVSGGEGIQSAAEDDTIVVEEGGAVGTFDESGTQTMSGLEAQMQTIYFAFDKFDITTESADKVRANAGIVNAEASEFNLKIEGNCDEWGSDEYNFALGLKRAKAAKDAMVAEGVGAERITMVSYGESNPVCLDKTKECWAKNRRADFKLLP